MDHSRAGNSRTQRLRVATYNVHKCRGLDGRVRPDRILRVLSDTDADIIALQEVVCVEGKHREHHQARYLAEELGFHAEIGENRRHKGGAYGNALLSRFAIGRARNYDLSVPARERRGCLRTDIDLESGGWLHIFNLHLGTSFFERRKQARRIFGEQILTNLQLGRNKIILGDLNEWTEGLASRLLRTHFKRAEVRPSEGRSQSYPGILPLLQLDHIYFGGDLRLEDAGVHRSRKALLASDHLPFVAEFSVLSAPEHRTPGDSVILDPALPDLQTAVL